MGCTKRNGSPATGQQRLGGTLSLAVDPRAGRSGTVYLAWADQAPGSILTIHVRRSTDRGVTWSPADLVTVLNATNAALAINSAGAIGLLYQQLTGTGAAVLSASATLEASPSASKLAQTRPGGRFATPCERANPGGCAKERLSPVWHHSSSDARAAAPPETPEVEEFQMSTTLARALGIAVVAIAIGGTHFFYLSAVRASSPG